MSGRGGSARPLLRLCGGRFRGKRIGFCPRGRSWAVFFSGRGYGTTAIAVLFLITALVAGSGYETVKSSVASLLVVVVAVEVPMRP